MTSELSVREAESAQATKDLVFETAERLFALHGFQKVSVRDITAEAGVNLASVNYHFGSKDALLFEIFKRRTELVKDAPHPGSSEIGARLPRRLTDELLSHRRGAVGIGNRAQHVTA